MRKASKSSLVAFTLVASFCTIGGLSTAWGRGDNVPIVHNQATLSEDEVMRLVLMLDHNHNGKISKDEFMKFMSSEFDRLDRDKSGELDVKELRDSQIRVAHPETFTSVGK